MSAAQAPQHSYPEWLEPASNLLSEPDPGPTPWLIQDIIVDQALGATVGPWKTTKTYWNLDSAISMVTGEPFLGRHEITNPGPIIVVLEESGRAALWRRLDALCRGRAIDKDRLHHLHTAANKRVRLDDTKWQAELIAAGHELKPRAYLFDPLARMKAAGLDESSQKEYGRVIEFMRDLRDETQAAVIWTHHTGHLGGHMRGTSDLESVWETRLGFKKDNQTVKVTVEHREAESGLEITYRLDYDHDTRTMRLQSLESPQDERYQSAHKRITLYIEEHPGASGRDIEEALGGRAELTRKILNQLATLGTHHRAASQKTDAAGRTITYKGWYPNTDAGLRLVPQNGTHQDATDGVGRASSTRPPSLDGDEGRTTVDAPPTGLFDDSETDPSAPADHDILERPSFTDDHGTESSRDPDDDIPF